MPANIVPKKLNKGVKLKMVKKKGKKPKKVANFMAMPTIKPVSLKSAAGRGAMSIAAGGSSGGGRTVPSRTGGRRG